MKNIVMCCDGTGNEYGQNNTNVVEIYSLALKNEKQITYYDPGIGTGGWEYEEESGILKAKMDQATGTGLQKNIENAYQYLMDLYEEGDRIYLFGFSRGAFTVRSLAGMLYKCGLLRSDNDNLVEYASKVYNTKNNEDIASGFKVTFSRNCPVYFIGVWDTVDSLIMNARKKFHDTKLNVDVTFGYQALSIDEKRRDFPPCMWNEERIPPGMMIQQVWFSGVHSDVGGWYDERGLSNIPLKWMVHKALACDMDIDEVRAEKYVEDPHDQKHESFSGFWKFRRSRVRKIPEGALIHKSVFERMWKGSNRYKPKNLPKKYKVIS